MKDKKKIISRSTETRKLAKTDGLSPKEIQFVKEDLVHPQEKLQPFLKWKYESNEATGTNKLKSITLSDGSKIDEQSLRGAIKRATGAKDPVVGEKILKKLAYCMSEDSHEIRLNEVSELLPALEPKNETEALLLGQFLALQDSGMKCLRNANSQSMFYHIERLHILATKLFNTANQTMQAFLKYRSGGQQVVQVIHVHNEGNAIVAQNLSHNNGDGVHRKSDN